MPNCFTFPLYVGIISFLAAVVWVALFVALFTERRR
jgi:hypothetical protein